MGDKNKIQKGAVIMKINVQGKGIKVGDQLQRRIEEKLGKFNRFFGDEATANVKVRPEAELKCIEVTLKIQNHFYRAESVADDVFTALDQAVEVMEGQIRKHKTKIEKRIHDYAYMKEYLKTEAITPEEQELEESAIIKRKSFALSPMDADEAVLQMEMLGHSFLLYLDMDTDKVCVVYKRKDGNYGLIEPEY
ncbi:MAG: putative sigma-54 modulation protein [Clostridiales bacterium]|jgi:putative sigma-54 modulation protein|nr:ribosome-associated translation inhibitor RaiA [Eubacteriales bacterium]MDD3197733.1 ribosome-associated translation inhibitor RaiA [Eubacteriales bacterium]MDD3503124.1 ribosome-associated translation inhibitor RaiA [Eubacteriales bacterium]MDD4683322.1 ribosome-associated translation inhibitor RaiA [Eubacteriales bacterium]MDN5315150.1 putative sigma-54 modulation protein [Clostridiales bacterium]